MEEQWHVMNVYGQKMIGDYAILYELVFFFKEFNKVTKKPLQWKKLTFSTQMTC